MRHDRRPRSRPILLPALILLPLLPACGATAGPVLVAAAPMSADQRAVLETVETIFQGMRTADSALIRSVFHDGARFAMIAERDGVESVQYAPVDGWLNAVAGSDRRWDERIYDVDIRVDRPIASAWTPYTFYLDGRVRHCGVNTIELLLTPDGWKVTQLSDSRRQDGCPDPLASSD